MTDELTRHMPNANCQHITVEKLQKFVPKNTSIGVTQAIVDEINSIEDKTGLPQDYAEEGIMSSMHLLSGSGVTLQKLVNAVKYSYLCDFYSNKKSWSLVFPDKAKEKEDEGKAYDNFVSAFEKSKLVIEIKKQMMVPISITYRPLFHRGMMRLAGLMDGRGATEEDKVSAHVQFLAAKEITDKVKPPEENKLEIDISIDKGSIIDEYEKAITMMAEAKMAKIVSGGNMLDAINAPVRAEDEIIDVDVGSDTFNEKIHDVDVYEKYSIIVKRKD